MIFALSDHPPFDCATCKDRENHNCQNQFELIDPAVEESKTDPYYKPQWFLNDVKSKWRGKYKGTFPTVVVKLLNIRVYECPLTWITRDTIRIRNLLFMGEKPEKIHAGTWLDQPQWYIEAVNIYRKVQADLAEVKSKNNG